VKRYEKYGKYGRKVWFFLTKQLKGNFAKKVFFYVFPDV
jgi:hypothetical protein